MSGSIEETLRRRRRLLDQELAVLTAPPTDGAAIGFGKRVGEGTTEAVERLATTAAAKSISASITEIDRALGKIEEGTYGTCDACGDAIGEARLEARPATPLCVVCASETPRP